MNGTMISVCLYHGDRRAGQVGAARRWAIAEGRKPLGSFVLEAVFWVFPRPAEAPLVGQALQPIALLHVSVLIVTPACQQTRRSYFL